MITSDEMAVVDANAAALGVSQTQLMESAGNAVARAVREEADPDAEVAVVCGRGNNGGDGSVAARFLSEYDVSVHLLGRAELISTDVARENYEALESAELDVQEVADSTDLDLGDPDVVVDAVLGTGVSGGLREPEATAVARVNAADVTVVSVDVPTGLDPDTGETADASVDADRVVTFHDAKPGLSDLEAEVTVADIGIPEAAARFVGRGDLLRLSRDSDAHKGDFGRVLVVGGGPYTGAPALSAMAALRAGADLAFVACPAAVAPEVQGYSPDLIVDALGEADQGGEGTAGGSDGDRLTPAHVDQILEAADDVDCIVVGPGLGDADETLEAVAEILGSYEGAAVVDADALQVVPDVETSATLVCTPHQGELEGMGGETADDWSERADLVEAFAEEVGATLLVKGAHDVISDGETTRVNRTGNPGMTVGGTGDVLAGVTAALACVLDPIDAAALGAYANGSAGDDAVEEWGYGLTASDLLESVPGALWPDDQARR